MANKLKVVGLAPMHKKGQEMKNIWDLCIKNNVPIPDLVQAYFGSNNPEEGDVQTPIKYTEWKGPGMSKRIEVKVEDIPGDVVLIRFISTY